MTAVLVATDQGLLVTKAGAPYWEAAGHRVTGLVSSGDVWAAAVDGRAVWIDSLVGTWEPVASLPMGSPGITCLAYTKTGFVIGTSEAHLLRMPAAGRIETVASFDQADGRDTWYTPWGGPPDTRSLAAAPDGTLYVNVHVGGILRSDDGGGTWVPTIDVDADVHQVTTAVGGDGDVVLAATAYGLARSDDRGASWTFHTAGLHADYSRAVAVAGKWLLLSSSTGPGSGQAVVYRRPLDASGDTPFERCRGGLPEWFAGNVDTGCLVADGPAAALASADGTVYVSDDAGATWRQTASGLGSINCLGLAGPGGGD